MFVKQQTPLHFFCHLSEGAENPPIWRRADSSCRETPDDEIGVVIMAAHRHRGVYGRSGRVGADRRPRRERRIYQTPGQGLPTSKSGFAPLRGVYFCNAASPRFGGLEVALFVRGEAGSIQAEVHRPMEHECTSGIQIAQYEQDCVILNSDGEFDKDGDN